MSVELAFAYLRRRWGQALLSIIVGALGIAAVATAVVGFDALPDAAERSWGGADMRRTACLIELANRLVI